MKIDNAYKSQPETIKKMFGQIAPNYDRANSLLSFNLHKGWNRQLVKHATEKNPTSLLDLCAGTGEITYTWLNSLEKTHVKNATLLDFCPEMLKKAKERSIGLSHHHLLFLEGDAQEIKLDSGSMEAITMAYGIRNVKDPLKCFKEAYRVLKPGGQMGILELTEPSNFFIKTGHNFYLRNILPTLGGWVTRQPEAYQYLSRSIQAFVRPETLCEDLKLAGFTNITLKPLTFGIAHLFIATKPANVA